MTCRDAAVIAFLNVSEDELDLRDEDWISTETWELWRAGMAGRLRRAPSIRSGHGRSATGLCIAVAERLGLPLTGGDKYWSNVPLQVEFLPLR